VLKEIQNIADKNRRWFSDDYFDLIAWNDADQRVSWFQLCYDTHGIEHALTWVKGKGMDHHRIDSGEVSPLKNMTPVLIPGGAVPYDKRVRLFTERAVNSDRDIHTLVLRQLLESRGEDVLGTRKVR